jgi:hypothetical protein
MQRTAQVEAASVLAVVVRWGPVRTAVTGTLLARPVRTTWYPLAPLAPTLGVGEARPRRPTATWTSREGGAAARV